MNQMMTSLLQAKGMSCSSNTKPEPIVCSKCSKEKPQAIIKHPFTGKEHWVHCACPCEIKELENFKKDQQRQKRRIRIQHMLKASSTMEDISRMRIENFTKREGTAASMKEIADAVNHFEKRQKLGVLLFGETGNGKSHLTAAGGNALMDRGYAVIFITEKDLFNRFQATRNFKNTETFGDIMGACLEADLLIWDDFLSSQRLTQDEKDWIFQIVNGRERANKPIWATSNMTPDEFNSNGMAYKLDDKGRTWWRMLGNMNCVYNKAGNYRKEMAIQRAQKGR